MKPAIRVHWFLPALSGLFFLGLWTGLHYMLSPGKRFVLPTPLMVWNAVTERSGELLSATRWTALAALYGLLLAVAGSIILALLMGVSRWVRSALYPYLMALQMTPIIIVAPILILWVGPGMPSVVLVTFLICFFPMVVNNTQGLLSVDRNLEDLFRMGRASRWQQLWLLRVPSALPYFFTGLRIAAVLAPIGALTGDYQVGSTTGGQSGLGITALLYSARSEIPALYGTAFLGCALGFVFVSAVSLLNWLTLQRWHESYVSRSSD